MSGTHRDTVLVSMDSLRADHCGHLGDNRNRTPTMDSLADDGVMFENAIVPGHLTIPSMPAAFTGRHQPPTTLEGYPYDTNWKQLLAAAADHLHRYFITRRRVGARDQTQQRWAGSYRTEAQSTRDIA